MSVIPSVSGEPSIMGLMDRDSQHLPWKLTPRVHELTTVSGHAVLQVAVDNKHNGCLLTTQYTQKYVTWAGFRHRTDRHAHRRSCSGHSGAPPATDPLSARLGPPRPQVTQHIHLDQLQRQLCAVEDLCSDHAASAAIAMPRKLPCPLDGGEDGPLAMRAASQPTALCPFEASPLPPLCVASCEDVALARTPSKGRDDFARPVAVAGQEGRRACPRAPEGRAKGRRAAAGWGEWLPWAARSRA